MTTTAERTTLPESNKTADQSESPRQWRQVRFEVLEKIEDLPSFSSVVVEFMELSRREFFSAKDFEAVICKDQGLVARLLKIANCGLYGRSRTIHSIPEAIVLIGLDNLKKIVYAVSSQGMMTRQMTHYGYHEDQGFWIHSMAVGQTAKILAEACPECCVRPEEIFVAGLLHDVGKLVLDGFLGERPHLKVSNEMEISAVGLNHAELAGHILKQWNIPPSITGPILYHHEYQATDEWQKPAAFLALARGICSEWGLGYQSPIDLSREVPKDRFAGEMEAIGLNGCRWEAVIWNIQQSLSGLEDLFQKV